MLDVLAVVIPLVVGECRVESAVVTHIPPATAHVVTVSECGGITCWSRWIDVDGKRLAETRVCTGERSTLVPVP